MKYRQYLIDDFEDHAAGEIVANQSGSTWAAEAGDDDLAIVTAGSLYVGANCLRFHDESRTTQASVTKTLPFTLGAGDIFRIGGIKPVTGDYASDYLLIKLREAASVIIWLKLVLTTGLIYYSTDSGTNYTTTGVTLTLDAWNTNLDIEMTSIGASSTFKVRLNSGAWTSAFACDNDATAGITKVEFTTNEANDDGGVVTQNIDENFEGYTPPNSIIGGQWTWVVGPSGADSMTAQAGQVGRFTYAGAGRSQVAFDFDSASASSPAAGWWVSHKGKVVNTGTNKGCVFMVKSSWGPVSWLEFHDDGKIYALDNNVLDDTGATWSAGTQYVIKIEGASATTYNAYLDGNKIADAKTNYGGGTTNGQTLTKFAMDTNFFGSINADGQTEVDDITVSWNTSTVYTAGDTDVYIDELWGLEKSSSDVLQVKALEYLGSSTKKITSHLAHEQADGSILCLVQDTTDDTGDIYRISGADLSTWTKYIDGGASIASTSCRCATTAAGTVYCVNKISGGVHYMAKSSDYGATADYNKSTGFAVIYDVFTIAGTLYVVTVTNAANKDTIRIQKLDSEAGDPITWTERATLNTNHDSALGAGTYGPTVIHGFVAGSTYWFIYINDGGTMLHSYVDTPTLTEESVLTASAAVGTAVGRPAIIFDDSVTWTHTSSGRACVPLRYGGANYLYRTTNGGDTWTAASSGYWLGCDDLQATGEPLAIDTTTLFASRLNEDAHYLQRLLTPDISAYATTICVTHNCVLACNGTTTRVYKLGLMDAPDAGIVGAESWRNIVMAGSTKNRCEFTTTSSNPYNVCKGAYVEFYDCWDTLEFRGIVTAMDTSAKVIKFAAEDSTREVANPYGSDFTAAKLSAMLDSVVDGMGSGAYAGSFQDVNYAGTMDYDLSEYRAITALIRLHRILERSVIWTTPGGQWNSDHYDDCDATGYRVHEGQHQQWRLLRNAVRTIDARLTRTSVYYAGPARYTYTGDANRDVTEGTVIAREVHDLAIEALADATDVATQLFNILNTATTFATFLVSNFGFVQEGKTVDASYSLGNTTLARANYIILGIHRWMLQDVSEITISNNIVSRREMENLELEADGVTD